MNKITLRPMTQEDFDAAADIVAQNELWQRYEYDARDAKTSFELAFYKDDESLIVATNKKNEVVGFAWFQPTGGLGRAGYLRLIGVHPRHQSKGIGKLLLQEVEKGCPSHILMILVSHFNERAQKFYKREGYVQAGVFEKFVRPDIDELLFWKKFTPPAGL